VVFCEHGVESLGAIITEFLDELSNY